MRKHEEVDSTDQADIDIVMLALCAHITSYDLWDMYNMDKTRLFYNMVPNQTIAQQ